MGLKYRFRYPFFWGIASMVALFSLPAAAQRGEVTPTSWDYGNVLPGEAQITSFEVLSLGSPPLAITSISLPVNPTGAFSIVDINPSVPPFLLEAEWINVFVDFAPLTPGHHTASLVILSDNEAGDIRIPLIGYGIPEPTTLFLLGTGALFFLRRR